jgi:virulence-associated protein VapD
MFAIAFDLVVKDTEQHHPKRNCSHAYHDIRNTVRSSASSGGKAASIRPRATT